MHEGTADIAAGRTMAKQGDVDAGIATIQAGLTKSSSTCSRLAVEQYLGHLADALAAARRFDEALRVLADAEGACRGEVIDRADTLRRRAELLPYTGAPGADVEATLEAPLDWARRPGARSYELNTSTSLARRWRDRGKRTEARELFASVYAGFTEGFGTRDLKEAKALLDELA